MHAVRQRVLDVMAEALEAKLASFDAKTGRFPSPPAGPLAPGAKPEETGWFICNQDIVYGMAVLYATPGTKFYGDKKLLDTAFRAGDAIRDFQYPDGQVEFLKADGSRWGPTYMPWTNYAWLEAFALLGGEMDAARRARWKEGLTLAHDGQAREIDGGRIHNIPCWKAMSCYRAGVLFDRADWRKAGTTMIERTIAAQRPGGYWDEHGGPTAAYNYVYVHGVGLYYVFSGDERARPALESAAEFHQAFTYPDGSVVETADGRVKYGKGIPLKGWPGFSATPVGRRLVRYYAERLDAARDGGGGFFGGAFGSAVQHLLDGDEAPILLDREEFREPYRDLALLVRSGPWFACLSAVATEPVASRWGQDRQAFLSLWHREHGLLLGGGNSKDQPEWSTFVADGRTLPSRGEVLGGGEGVALEYGRVRCTLKLRSEGARVEIEGSADGGPALQQFVLKVKAGDAVKSERGREAVLGEGALRWGLQELGAWLEVKGLRIEVPHGAEFRWPTAAFNPYAIDGAAPFGSAAALLSARIDEKPVLWRLGSA